MTETRQLQEGGSFPDPDILRTEAIHGLFLGKVIKRNDPDRRGRVKVRIENMLEETRWAEPLGMPGAGGPPGGGFCVPEQDAQVAVGFFMGDLDAPYYFSGPPAVAETPEEVSGQSQPNTPKTHAFETTTFEVFITDNDSEQKLTLRTKLPTKNAENNNEIEIDAKDGSIQITASNYLIMRARQVELDGAVIVVGNRLVKKVGIPI